MFYSKQTGGFYDSRIHGNNIPDDSVEITDEEYQILLNGQSSGKVIIADENGRPVLSDPVVTETLSEKLLKLAQAYKADLQEFNLHARLNSCRSALYA